MGYLAAVEPDAVIFAAIDNHTATMAKHAPIHKRAAYRAFDVFNDILCLITVFVDIVELLQIDVEDMGHGVIKQRFYFSGLKKQAETVWAAFYQEGGIGIQINGL